MMNNGIGSVLIALAIWALVFLVFRVIVLWYWKVNQVVALLKSIVRIPAMVNALST
jgi:hypothetical protein